MDTPNDRSYPQVSVNDEQVLASFVIIPPDGGWGWVIVTSAFFTFFVCDGVMCSFGVFLDDMAASFNCTKSQVALTGAIMTGFFCLSGPFASALVNQFGYRYVAIGGSLLAITACLLTSKSNSIYDTFGTLGVLGGIGFGIIYMPAVIAVGFYFERWRALATGIAVCGAGIGTTVMPLTLSMCVQNIGWRHTFEVIAALSGCCAFLGIFYKRLEPIKIVNPDIMATSEKLSSVSTNKQSFFTSFHNTSHPTVADLTRSRVIIPMNRRPTKPTVSIAQDTYSTVTIYKPYKQLPKSASSEYVISETLSTPSDGSSFKSYNLDRQTVPKGADSSRLSTVYEDTTTKTSIKRCCSCGKRKRKKDCCNYNCCYYCDCCCCPCKKCSQNKEEVTFSRPLYRDDIFYSSSLMFLPEYRKSFMVSQTPSGVGSKSNLEYNMRVTRTVTQKEIQESTRCGLCTVPVKRTLATMLDLTLLKSPSFMLLSLNSIFLCMGIYTPFMFIVDRALEYNVSKGVATWLISCIGLCNTIGRVVCGIIASFSNTNAIKIIYISLIVAGLSTIVSELYIQTTSQFIYAAIYGFSIAPIAALRTIIMVEMLSLEKLTNAVGITLLFQGVASLSGTSVASFLRDLSNNYALSFYFAGGSIFLSSLFLIPIKRVMAWEKKKKQRSVTINV